MNFKDIKAIKVGDEIDVLIEKLENKEGTVVLSHEKAEFKKNWDKILTICNEGGRITGKVKSIVKGGLVVNVGVEAFLPASQIDIITPKNLTQFVGNSYEFKVVKINQERQNIVLSRRELIEQERNEKRAKLLAEMVPGDIRKGTVKNITDFGAFIDLNGIDGLLHITDMSWGRIGHPSEVFKVGQEIDVVVLDVNKEKERVSLGLKQKMANPWDNIERNIPVGAEGQGQGRQPRALRRVCAARTRRGRPRPRHRTFLDQARRQTQRRAQAGPGNRSGRARHQPRGAENFPRHPPVGKQSVGQRRREISRRHQGQGQGAQPHQLRRVCGTGRRH
jgi:transcriptional accessory protein Tex/SPT6